ncbi:Spermidine/putrescine-binding periplasmic protein precursor [Clostridium liquoris]|jgi:putative spermidine/putrescine transport system substrate-binding protein|uniref:Spermidine/putrescine-binding periplasmic protein n=1 Tax=Clostridium liquoris TaxID=1289519 RepID=A0A2T0B3T2_9CLOT|nr:ABC transporter substrate-binding protein [Clostridium liquoris]PRR78536.1 Spermidine/putrescine-binding periplasmic protein precursor [Clostridium liquoris]
MKRRLIALSLALTTILTFAGCGSSNSKNEGKGEQKKLVISTWGLNEDKLREDVFKPFEEKNNVKIVLETGNNSERLTKLKNNPNSDVDLMYLAESFSEDGAAQGLFDKVDYSKISNSEKLNSKAKAAIKEGFGPAYTLNRIAIAYDPKKVGFEIKSWKDLWRPELKGKIAIPDITTTFGPAMVYIAGIKAGVDVTKDKGEAAFKQLEALKPNVVKTYSKSSDLTNMFASGEIAAAVTADFVYGNISKAAPDVKYVDPVEGTFINFNTINIAKNSKNKDLALEFINYALSAEVQKRTAKGLGESPVNTDVKLSPEESKNLTYGDVIEKSNTIDYKFVNPLMKDWIDKWNRILN